MNVGYFCIFLQENGRIQKVYVSKMSGRTPGTLLFSLPFISLAKASVSLDDLEKLFFYLGQFLGAHLSLKQSFENLEIPSLSRSGKKFVKDLCRHVESGHALSSFFKANDMVSDHIILSTILIAEKTGHWDLIFGNLSEYIQKMRAIRHKIQEILFYPLMVISVLILFMIFILPQIVTNLILFIPPNEIPFIAHIFMKLQDFGVFLIPFLCVPLLLWARFKNVILRKILGVDLELEHFFYLLSFLLQQKIPLTQALDILEKEKKFPSINLQDIHKSLQEGKSISAVFEEQNRFPKFVISLFKLSQETSNITENAGKIYRVFHQIHEKSMRKTIEFLPNVLILIIGGVFILLLLGLFLPLYDNVINLVEKG